MSAESDSDRFTTLVRPHYGPLYRAAFRLTRSAHDAEDLVQEVCARAYPRITELAALDKPGSWLLRVLYRLYIDLSRRYERTHVRSIGDDDHFAAATPGPEEEADRALDRWRLERAWQKLDHEQRVLLALHDVEGYSLVEVQALTGLKIGTIKSRLHRARVRLGRFLDDAASPTGRRAEGEA